MTARPPSSGTVYTPDDLARAVVHSVGGDACTTWLDPCVGEGALLRAIAARGVDAQRITALDLDTRSGASDRLATTARGVDFLAWSRETTRRFGRVIANPPYVPVGRLPRKLRDSALRTTGPGSLRIALISNYWSAFLLASLSLLEEGGSLAFILPASFEYANYARALRRALPSQFASVEVHRCAEPMFGRVRDGCVVLAARGFGATASSRYVRTEYSHPSDLIAALEDRTRARGETVVRLGAAREHAPETRALSEIISVRLGGVTGDARYFLMTEAERRARDLPLAAVTPVLTRSAHLGGATATNASWRRLRDAGERIWLFNPPEKLTKKGPVCSYVRLAPADGGCARDGFKVSRRDPWYRTPLPRAPHGFMSGMSRFGPWICLREMPRLTATNTLYVVHFVERLSAAQRAAWALALLTTSVRSQLANAGRVYPDGLRKHEPNDLSAVRVPVPPSGQRGASAAYRKAVAALLAGDHALACAIADAWFVAGASDHDARRRLSRAAESATSTTAASRAAAAPSSITPSSILERNPLAVKLALPR